MRFHDAVLVDNVLGVNLQIGRENTDVSPIKFYDSYIFGESTRLASDCPAGATGGNCKCVDKVGFTLFGQNVNSKQILITS